MQDKITLKSFPGWCRRAGQRAWEDWKYQRSNLRIKPGERTLTPCFTSIFILVSFFSLSDAFVTETCRHQPLLEGGVPEFSKIRSVGLACQVAMRIANWPRNSVHLGRNVSGREGQRKPSNSLPFVFAEAAVRINHVPIIAVSPQTSGMALRHPGKLALRAAGYHERFLGRLLFYASPSLLSLSPNLLFYHFPSSLSPSPSSVILKVAAGTETYLV